MKTVHYCEKCGLGFFDKDACWDHEKDCSNTITFLCQKCGKVISWDKKDDDCFIKENQCHTIDLGRMGYGSKFDGSYITFDICDTCLEDILNTFRYKSDIYNSSGEKR
ncbi:MAG TPA: hypothetical protein DGK91_10935 [Clostridium sp.]|nr:hypothetical protein [Clostridium sp.]HHU98100.1 hypothetical protein [Petrimonas sp.]